MDLDREDTVGLVPFPQSAKLISAKEKRGEQIRSRIKGQTQMFIRLLATRAHCRGHCHCPSKVALPRRVDRAPRWNFRRGYEPAGLRGNGTARDGSWWWSSSTRVDGGWTRTPRDATDPALGTDKMELRWQRLIDDLTTAREHSLVHGGRATPWSTVPWRRWAKWSPLLSPLRAVGIRGISG